LGRIIAERGSFLKNLDVFDYLEFGITSKDARAMAASTRKLIELSFLALLDSGIDYRGKSIGCYASGIAFDSLSVGIPVGLFQLLRNYNISHIPTERIRSEGVFRRDPSSDRKSDIIPFGSVGTIGSDGHRVQVRSCPRSSRSRRWLIVDTSSSLTAMHLAVQALRTGDCEAAVVGGAQINQRSVVFTYRRLPD
jgi:hypothetical protein